MKKIFAYSILAILVLAGCQVKEFETEKQAVLPVQDSKPFVAIIEDDGIGSETKTTLDNSGKVLWRQSDQVSIFAGSTVNECYQVTDESEGKTSAALNKISGSGSGSALDNNVAFYPYTPVATISKSGSSYVISGIELPATQNYAEGSFANGAFPMAAITNTSEEMNLTFKNVLGGLKLQLKGTATITSITVTGNNGEILCGDAEVTVSTESNPSINLTDASAKTVTLDCGAGVTLNSETATTFIIALPPMTMTGGFTVTVTDTEGKEMEIKTTRTQTITRSSLLKMPSVDYVGTHANIAYLYLSSDSLPNEVDKTAITEVHFYVSDPTTTGTILFNPGDYAPVYFELVGTVANFYTTGHYYKCSAINFQGWTSLKSLDLSMCRLFEDTTSLSFAFMDCHSLQSLNLTSFDTSNIESMGGMFSSCWSLESLDLSGFQTSKVWTMSGMFRGCSSLKTLDLSSFDTSNVEDMSAMFGSDGTYRGCSALQSLDLHTFNTSNVTKMQGMFEGCYNLKTLNVSGWNTSNVTNMGDMFLWCTSLENLDLSSFDTHSVNWMGYMFQCCSSLKTLDLSNFTTSNVTCMYYMFEGCESLQSLNISSFDSSNLTDANGFLQGAVSLKQLNLGTFDVASIDNFGGFASVAKQSKRVAIRCTAASRQTIESLADGYSFSLDRVIWVGLDEDFPDMPDVIDPDMYYSSDYSMDMKVETIQTATIGNGVDIVIMGDAYSDRLIADGTYESDMREAINAIFAVEPMKSYKDLFNVYMVYAVSQNEKYQGWTVFGVKGSIGNSVTSRRYVNAAVPNKPFSDVAAIVIGHDKNAFTNGAGLTWISYAYSNSEYYDYGYANEATAYCGRWDDAQTYAGVVVHEFGHLFAKLADEYYEDETIDENTINTFREVVLHTGSYKNNDLTNDIETIKWNRLLNDARYANENLGAYEGGHAYYSRGVWRPTETSIMRETSQGYGFNAPSREAIYYRIHKLAYGEEWVYDYETFVQQDLKNIPQASPAPAPVKRASSSATVNRKHIFKMEESMSEDGKKIITIIQN